MFRRALPYTLFAAVLAGCGEPETCDKGETLVGGTCQAAKPPDDKPACASGETLLDDGRCQPAGLPLDMPPCAPGEALLDDGTCQKAGIPPDACGEGFMPDGEDGCEAILPEDPCPKGMMAVPGMTQCEEVAPCGQGTWGDITVEANTQYVDQAYQGGDSDGTAQKPWPKIQQGVDAAEDGAVVAVAAGTYAEDVLIDNKPVKLWGRCPSLVSVVGDAIMAAITIHTAKASKSEVHSLSATGQSCGLLVKSATDVAATSVWIHDTGLEGILVDNSAGQTSISVTGALVEGALDVGMWFSGGALAAVEKSVVRDTQPGPFAPGIGAAIVDPDSGGPSGPTNVSIRRSLFERNHYMGVGAQGGGTVATIESTVLRDTQRDPMQGLGAGVVSALGASTTIKQSVVERNYGIAVDSHGADVTMDTTVVRDTEADMTGVGAGVLIEFSEETSTRGNATIRSSLIEGSILAGVAVIQSDATIESTLIRDTQGVTYGSGLNVVGEDSPGARSSLTVRSSLVENSLGFGIIARFSDVLIESTVVRGTLAGADGTYGHGIEIGLGGVDEGSKVTIRGSLVEQNIDVGVDLVASDGLIESTTVRDTAPANDGPSGIGIVFQNGHSRRTNGTIRSCLIDQSGTSGLLVLNSDATIESTLVRATHASAVGQFGDGIVVETGDGIGPSQVTLTGNRIEASERAGLSNFGGAITLASNALVCSTFDIEGEDYMGNAFSFDNQGGNLCGCPDANGKCKVESANLEPPKPIEPAPGM